MKKKLIKYILAFVLGCLFTCILFIPSFNMDGICTKYYGYDLTSLNFLGAGRILTYLSYVFFAVIKLPISALSVLSILLSNIFLSISVVDIYEIINNEKGNKKLLFILSFLLIYNPITLELFLFDEAFIMCLGILFGIKGIKILNSNLESKYFISVIFTSLCAMCYQGVLCIFLPLAFLNIILRAKYQNMKDELKYIVKELFKVLLIYFLVLLINFVLLKCINIFIISSKKSATLNIFGNIVQAIRLCIWSIKTLDGYVNIKLYYFIMFLFGIYLIIAKINKKMNFKYMFYLLFTIALSIGSPFIINLAMNTSENYTAARMYVSIGFIIPIISIYIYKYFNILTKSIYKIIFYALIGIYFIFVFTGYIIISKGGLDSYNMDIKYINNIKNEITNYENESGKKVKRIYWAYDIDSKFCHDVGFCNSYSYRFFARDWSAESAIGVLNENIDYIKMSDDDKLEYFDTDINYTKYEREQLIFDNESLYLLIY